MNSIKYKKLPLQIKDAYYHLGMYLFLSITLLPKMLITFAWSDDYSAMADPEGMANHAIKDMRIIGGLAYPIFFVNFGSLENLKWVRIIGLILILIVASYFFLILSESLSKLRAVCVTLFILSSPPILVSLYWATGVATSILSLTLSVIGSYFLYRKSYITIGVIIVFISYSIYPLTALSVIAIFSINFLVKVNDELTRKRFLQLLTMHFSISVASFLSSWLGLKIFEIDTNPRARIISFNSLIDTFIFFLSRHLPLSFRFTNTSTESQLLLFFDLTLVLALIFITLLQLSKSISNAIFAFSALTFLLLVLLLPLILTGYNQIEPRFYIGGNILIMGILGHISLPKKDAISASLVILCFLSFAAYQNITFFQRKIQPIVYKTSNFLDEEVIKCSTEQVQKGVLVVRRNEPWEYKAEVGMLSQNSDLASDWVPLSAVAKFLEYRKLQTKQLPYFGENSLDESICKIDLNNLK